MHIILDKAKNDPFLVLVICYWVFQKKMVLFFPNENQRAFHMRYHLFLHYGWFPKTWSELICTRLYFFYCSTKHPDFVRHRVVIVKNFQLHGHKYKLWLGSISYILDIFCLNPNWIVAFGWCFFEKWSFSFLNFIQTKITLYGNWNVQLTFDTLINTFRFKVKPIGGAKVGIQ